jgi:hypothetical protein
MGEECSMNRGDEKCFIIVVGNLEGNRSLERPMRRWEDTIQIYFKDKVRKDVD